MEKVPQCPPKNCQVLENPVLPHHRYCSSKFTHSVQLRGCPFRRQDRNWKWFSRWTGIADHSEVWLRIVADCHSWPPTCVNLSSSTWLTVWNRDVSTAEYMAVLNGLRGGATIVYTNQHCARPPREIAIPLGMRHLSMSLETCGFRRKTALKRLLRNWLRNLLQGVVEGCVEP